MRILVDTDVMSYAFKDDSRSLLFSRRFNDCDLCISFMTVAETERWRIGRGWGPARVLAWRSFASKFMVLPVSFETCRYWAEVIEGLSDKGYSISESDAWIAATAQEVKCPPMTNNVRHFHHIDGLQLWAP